MTAPQVLRHAAIVGLVAIGLTGCAARSTAVVTQPVPVDALRSYKVVAVSVESGVTEDVAGEVAGLAAGVVSRLGKTGKFTQVRVAGATESAPGTLILKVTIVKVKKISSTARFLAGAFAGRANVTVDVKMIDAASGKTVGAQSVVGESGGSGLAGGTGDAVDKACEGIAKLFM